jgi:outer membrane protein assembly factor BamB
MKRTFPLIALLGIATVASTADWPQWRGPERTGISQEKGLLQEWPVDGPPLKWRLSNIGTGYSSPVVVGGHIYLQTTRDNKEFTIALDEKDGKELWKTELGGVGKNTGPQYPGTRATPTVDGDRIYSLASDGELVCLTTKGEVKWKKNLAKDFQGKVGAWAYTESVLVDGDWVICTPGGEKATLAALNKMTGEVIWKSEVPGGDVADYASIMILETDGRKEYVQFMRKGVVGVDAKTGKFLWRFNKTADMGANIMTPVVAGNKVFTSGSRSGGALVEIKFEGDTAKPNEIYFGKTLAPSIGGALLIGDNIFGTTSAAMFCADFATGKIHWSERGIGQASICYADGRIYARGHGGEIALIEPTTEGYREKGRFKQPDRSKSPGWPHPVVANGNLYIRDQDTLLSYDVKKK